MKKTPFINYRFFTILSLTLFAFSLSNPFSLRSEEGEPEAEQSVQTSEETAPLVREIHFTGNSLNKNRTLLRKIKSREKKPLDKKQIQEDIKILFETGEFDDVQADLTYLEQPDKKGRSLVDINFHVEERPIIKRIDFKGDRKIKYTAFIDKLQSKESAPFDRFKAALDERTILEYYRDEGYANSSVEHYTTIDEQNKKMILTFFITEGDRVLVKEIKIDGNERYKDKTIIRRMKTRRKKVFKDAQLREDKKSIENFYKIRGYLDIDISSSTVSIDDERNMASIHIELSEGPYYEIGEISIASTTIFEKKELRKAISLEQGKRFDQRKLDESYENLSGMYADKGYLRTEVFIEPVRKPEEGTVDFDVSFNESSVVYVDGVYVDGNTYTKTHVIKREVLLKQGDIFSAGRMRRSVEKIYNLGFLDDVQVDVQQPRDPNLADIIFTVKEGKPGILSAGAGFSSVDRFVGTFQIQHTNLFGLAQRLNFLYEFGSRRQNFDIGWTDPWFLGYRMSGGVDLFNTVRRRDYPGNRDSFREKRRGISLRLGPRLSDNFGLLFGYTIETNEIFDVDSSIKQDLFPSFGIPEDQALNTDSIHQIKSSFFTEAALDTRDNRFDATRGSRNAVSVELSGGPFGGDIDYYKPQVTTAWYFPTFWKFVFSVSGRFAWVNSFAPSLDVPASERFFLGGPDTVRGYDTNSIVPREMELNESGFQSVRNIPGRIMALFNAEYKFPIVQERNRTIFQGAFFIDVGGAWAESQDITFTTGALDRRMKVGAGFGFRFKTPVFPIRLDFAIPLTPRDTDITRQGDSRSLQPYFTIGNIF